MQTFNLSNVTPSAAAAKLADYASKPGAYASAIVAQGREFVEAVCAAVNARTEDKPEERRALYRVLHQAATRANAPFAIASRKHSGLSVTDKPAAESATEAGGAAPAAPKPGTPAEKIADLSRRLAESEAERKRLVALVATLTAERDALRAKLKGTKPAARTAKPAAAAVAKPAAAAVAKPAAAAVAKPAARTVKPAARTVKPAAAA